MTNDELDRQRDELATACGQPLDPLSEVETALETTSVDVFELFKRAVLDARDLTETTISHYEMVWREWCSYMETQGRHPACPTVAHVEAYIRQQLAPKAEGGKNNVPRTVKEKLRKLNQVYRYWQRDPAFPHPDEYNPIDLAKDRVTLTVRKTKEHRRIPIPELQTMVASVTNIRSQAIIMLQLKLGLRAGEVANIQLADIAMDDMDVSEYYPELGTHNRVLPYDDVIYIPAGDERDGNKSKRPRLLPLDDELRDVLNRYLFVRPDNGEPWLFLSRKSHTKLTNRSPNKIWKSAFHPEYEETDEHRAVTSHFGRHRFTTYWRVEQDLNRQLVKYMRGDRTGAYCGDRGMNAYLHAYYEDIESVYRAQMYTLCE